MSTPKAVRPSMPQSASSPFKRAIVRVQDALGRFAAPATSADDTSDLWQLYRMTRGSDSIRPVVVRKLASVAKRQPA